MVHPVHLVHPECTLQPSSPDLDVKHPGVYRIETIFNPDLDYFKSGSDLSPPECTLQASSPDLDFKYPGGSIGFKPFKIQI